MATVKVFSELMLMGLNPFSTNNLKTVFRGRIRNSPDYKDWKKAVASLLPDHFLPDNLEGFSLGFEMGVIRNFDIDNTLKGIIDCLEEKYGFNDCQIGHLIAHKTVVKLNEGEKPFVRIYLMEKIDLDFSERTLVESAFKNGISVANSISSDVAKRRQGK